MDEPVFIYVIATTGVTDVICKVGISKNPAKRLKQLQRTSDRPLSISDEVAGTADTAAAIERYAHWLLRDFHVRGEWFAVDDSVAWRAVREAKEVVAAGKTAEFRIAGAGRPHLKPTIPTVATMVRLRPSVRAQIKDRVGERNMAAFIRAAIEAELERRESSPNPQPKDKEGER